MKLFRKTPELSRHRRPSDLSERPSPSLSYYSRRSEHELNTGRDLQRENRKKQLSKIVSVWFWLERFGLIILLVAGGICLFQVLRLSTNAEVLPVSGNTASSFLHSEATYQAAADKLMASSFWDRNKITIDTGKLSRELQEEFPELNSVSITLPLISNRPIFYIQPTLPGLILIGNGGTYLLDTNGNALLAIDNPDAVLSYGLPVVTDHSGLKLSPGRQILTPEDISFIQTVVAQLTYKHFKIASMNLPAATSELDVEITGQPYYIKFNLESGDALQQTGTYLAVQANLPSQGITPTQYIDVRVDGRAYYK
jgi:hypothetical protein